MAEPLIVTSQVRLLDEQVRMELLALHRARKSDRKSTSVYEFDWLLKLIGAVAPIYTLDVRMGSATFTLYGPEDNRPLLPAYQ